jgi:hypothetical protein
MVQAPRSLPRIIELPKHLNYQGACRSPVPGSGCRWLLPVPRDA